MEEKLKLHFGEWYEILKDYLHSPEFLQIGAKVKRLRESGVEVLPEGELVFRAFREAPFNDVKLCIIAMDPYPQSKVGDGLAFSCSRSLYPQSSLKNILIEIEQEYPQSYFDITHWRLDQIDLQRWAKQGILLLNAALTVEVDKSGSHREIWEPFTKKIIETLNSKEYIVYLLLGKNAQYFEKYISTKHGVISAPHPAAESYNRGKAGFFGSNCFKEVNELLKFNNLEEIIW